jgi:aspartyl-tRNA(Asn)/glutamyl-tRNA(Gln) amidotransferase subunit C
MFRVVSKRGGISGLAFCLIATEGTKVYIATEDTEATEKKMAEKISRAEVEKVAKLARLELSEAEIDEFTGQLGAILEYVEKMNELDTQAVEPLAHCLPVHNVFRDDRVRESLGTDKTLANAPQRSGEFFRVPRILDESAG